MDCIGLGQQKWITGDGFGHRLRIKRRVLTAVTGTAGILAYRIITLSANRAICGLKDKQIAAPLCNQPSRSSDSNSNWLVTTRHAVFSVFWPRQICRAQQVLSCRTCRKTCRTCRSVSKADCDHSSTCPVFIMRSKQPITEQH